MAPMKLLDIVDHVRLLTDDAPYAVVGGLAQILWARKTHTDDLDITLAAADLEAAYTRVKRQEAMADWSLPGPPDRDREHNDVFTVCHLQYRGTVVDLLTFCDTDFTREILLTADSVPELGGVRFIRPELLLVTHLLRPGSRAALAAIELVLSRRETGKLDVPYARLWADRLGQAGKLARTLRRADEMELD